MAGASGKCGPGQAPPQITGFTPASGKPGETVTINGVNFIGTLEVNFGSVPAANFSVNAAGTQITAATPADVMTGPISVKTLAGRAITPSEFIGVLPDCAAVPTGLVGWWKAEGDATNASGDAIGELHNGITFGTGEVGQAFNLDGVDDYVGTTLDVQPSAMPSTTWEAWVFPARVNFSGRQQILSSDDGGFDRSVLVEAFSGNFGVFTGNDVWQPAAVTPNAWQHIAVVYTPTNIEFYKNGVRFARGAAPIGQATGFKLQIGRNTGFGEFFQGKIDEVSIYNRALSATEIGSIFAASRVGKCGSDGGTPAPKIVVSPTSLAFGSVPTGESKDMSLAVQNQGNAVLAVKSIAIDNPRFALASQAPPISISPGAAVEFKVRFAPTGAGDTAGQLILASDDPTQSTLIIALTGSGTAAAPIITKVEPLAASAGSVVALTGSGFSPVIVSNKVFFGGLSAVLVSATPAQLGVVVPPNLQAGAAAITVTVAENTSAPLSFQVMPATGVALSFAKSGKETVLSWPPTTAGSQLESTASLKPPVVWAPVTSIPTFVAGRNQVKVTPGDAARFFRLRNATSAPGSQDGGGATGHGRIIASTGGTIASDDQSVSIVIPPGALAQDTEVQITSVKVSPGADQIPTGDVFLSPEGLTFSKPVSLSVQVPNAPAGYQLSVELLSGENPPLNVGGEVSYFQTITNYTFNPADGQLEIPLNHFSGVSWWFAKKLYAVMDIPGKYLEKGDLLYVLTGADRGQGADWIPGHCGLYLGSKTAFDDSNDGVTIIEATQTHAGVLGEVRFDQLSSSVTGFKNLDGTHIYMGARRPANFELTANEKTSVADYAIGQLDKPYAIIGGGAFMANDAPLYDGFTCVGLTELAYEFGAGKRIVPHQTARILFTPFRQFQWTRPVDTARIYADEEFHMGVIGVVNRGFPGNDYYTDTQYYDRSFDPDNCNQDALDAIDAKRATFEPVFGLFSFKPIPSDAGKDFKFAFKIDATKSGAGTEQTAVVVEVEKTAQMFRRKDPPFIQTFASGNLNVTNLVIDPNGLEASTDGADNTRSRFRLSWGPPPATLSDGATFGMPIAASVGDDNPTLKNFSFGGPYIAADINESAMFSANPAFAGYEPTGNFSEHKLVARPLNKVVTINGVPSVTVYLDVFRTAGPFTAGHITGSVTWGYEPIQ